MTDQKRGGVPGAATPDIAARGAPMCERRITAKRKQEMVARTLRVTAADLSGWRDAFLEAGAASLKSRPRDDRDARIAQLQAKLGEVTMDCELLQERIARIEEGRPFVRRRSRR